MAPPSPARVRPDSPTPISVWRLASRQALRDLRAGELRLVLVAVILAVAALTAVGFFADRLSAGLSRDARLLLDEMLADSQENQVALRKGVRYAARLARQPRSSVCDTLTVGSLASTARGSTKRAWNTDWRPSEYTTGICAELCTGNWGWGAVLAEDSTVMLCGLMPVMRFTLSI